MPGARWEVTGVVIDECVEKQVSPPSHLLSYRVEVGEHDVIEKKRASFGWLPRLSLAIVEGMKLPPAVRGVKT